MGRPRAPCGSASEQVIHSPRTPDSRAGDSLGSRGSPPLERWRTGARPHVTRIHPLPLPSPCPAVATAVSKLCPQIFREAVLTPPFGNSRCVVVVGAVDSVDNHCFRTSEREFLSTGLVGNPVGNFGSLWTAHAAHRLSTRFPQLHPQFSPRLSTATGLETVVLWSDVCSLRPQKTRSYPQGRSGFPQVFHTVVHRFCPLPVDNSAKKVEKFFSARRTYLSNPDKAFAHTFVHRLPFIVCR